MPDLPSAEALARALERERKSRREAERLLEVRALSLYDANQALAALNRRLEERVEARTAESLGAHARLRTLIEHLPFGVVVEDVERRVVLVNAPASKAFGLDPAECTSEHLTHVCACIEEPEQFLRDVEAAISDPTRSRTGRIVLRDGRVYSWEYVPVGDDGSMHEHMWSYRDVTEATTASRQLQRAREIAEAANEQTSRFLAMMSHELRTPLSVIVGAGELLASQIADSEHRRLLERVRANASSMLHLITEMLEYARIEAGAVTLASATFDPVALVEDIVETHAQHAFEKGLEFVCEIDPNIPPNLLGDAPRLRQVITNLVTNAIKFTERGCISISLRQLPSDDDRVHLECRVTDTGRGIADEDRSRIFDRFVRVERDDERAVAGTGLGLSICAALVELMDGQLTVDSRLGRGSTFVVTSTHRRAEVSGPHARAPVPSSGVRTVAILGALASTLSPTRGLVEGLGLRARVPPRDCDVIEWLCEGEAVDAIIYDPEGAPLDETDLVTRLSSTPTLRDLPRIRLYRRQPLHGRDAERLGIWAQIAKPLRSTVLAAVLHSLANPQTSSRQSADPSQVRLRWRRSVLLVDDDPQRRPKLATQLRICGLDVDVAPSGQQALRRAEDRDYGLVLTTLHMATMDGYALAMALRASESQQGRRRSTIVGLVGPQDTRNPHAYAEAGIDAVTEAGSLPQMLERWLPVRPVVLVVDDSPDLRAITALRLQRCAEIEVAFAASGEEALQRVREGAIALILMDLHLPGLDGIATIQRMRMLPALRDLAAVAVTGDVGRATKARALAAGFDDFLSKPLTEEQLRGVVLRFLGDVARREPLAQADTA